MIPKLPLLFGSKMKAEEILLLQHGTKPVVRHGYYESELPKVRKFCDENNLYLVKSNFKVLLADESGYSNKGTRISEDDKRPGMYFVYISKDEEKAWLAAYHEMMNNHRELGLSLGYPKCCVEFFFSKFPQNVNPVLKPTNPFTNLTKRSQDSVLISHFPCSSDCPNSIEMGKNNHRIISKLDKVRGQELIDVLGKL